MSRLKASALDGKSSCFRRQASTRSIIVVSRLGAFEKVRRLIRHLFMQDQRQRGSKVYSLHAPEVESIGKRKAHRPSEFGVKVSVATTRSSLKGGQFVTHIAALQGNPYDGHTMATVIPAMEDMIGNTIDPNSPMPVIAATMRQLTTSSGSIRQARSGCGSSCRSDHVHVKFHDNNQIGLQLMFVN